MFLYIYLSYHNPAPKDYLLTKCHLISIWFLSFSLLIYFIRLFNAPFFLAEIILLAFCIYPSQDKKLKNPTFFVFIPQP